MIELKTKPQGAEITSIKKDGQEKIHDGKKDWNRNAPVLFPIVGQIKNGETEIEGKTYKMGQHGFARDMEFETIGENTYKLTYNEETLQKYPYRFELIIKHEIIGENAVTTTYTVNNIDEKPIYFGLGGHPAFICDYKNAEIEFEKEEDSIEIYQLDNGLIKQNPEDASRFTDKKTIKLNKNIFDNDAIIMKKLKSNYIILKEKGKQILKFDFTEFPILAIWSKKGANFLCVEPWFNTTDTVSSNGKFIEKEGIIKLNSGDKFEAKYKMIF